MKVIAVLLGLQLVAYSHEQTIIDQTAVAGSSTNINIQCNLGRQTAPPFWVINGTAYELFSIPFQFQSGSIFEVNRYSVLTIPIVRSSLDNLYFQCVVASAGSVVYDESITRLTVVVVNVGYEDPPPVQVNNFIRFNYNSFNKEADTVTVGWIAPENNTCRSFGILLQGFTLNSLQSSNLSHPANIIAVQSLNTAVVSSNNLRSGTEDLYYRIVTVFDNGTVCENQLTDNQFYRFTGTPVTDVRLANQNRTTCFNIPSEENNCPEGAMFFVYQGISLSVRSCFCSINPPNLFDTCSCILNSSQSSLTAWRQNGSICVLSPINETRIHFTCHQDDCDGENDCFTRTIIESHLIVLPDPPDTPDVSLNASSLCLSAYSRPEFPVLYFDAVVMDVTGIPSNLTGRHYVTSGNKVCLPITSGPTPNICTPIQVSVSATNTIGRSTIRNITTDSNNTDDEDCTCYKEREEIEVDVAVETSSANVTAFCDLMESLDFLLESSSPDQSEDVSLFCEKSTVLPNLTPDTFYTLSRRYFMGQTCEVKNFTTMEISTTSTPVRPGGRSLSTAGIVIIVIVVIVFILIAIGCVVCTILILRCNHCCCWKKSNTPNPVSYRKNDEQSEP